MKVFLPAMGVVCAAGSGKREVAGRVFAGSRDGLVMSDAYLADRAVRIGPVAATLPEMPARLAQYDCRNNRLAMAALGEIETDVAAAVRRFGRDRVAVVMGTSTSGIAEGEEALAERLVSGQWPARFDYRQQELGGLSNFVADYLGLRGPAYTVAAACASSGKVFASARRLIAAGYADAAVVGGADSLCRLTVNGFASLEALARDYCNPFSRNRDGINIGEGAAMFLVTGEPAEIALLGVGESSDAHHVSAPDPAGEGAVIAIRQALQQAGLASDDIDYVNLHGTATPLNDVMEGRAMARIFGAATPPCSSTKSMTGHMLGAAGAAEAAILWLTLSEAFSGGRLPPHLWDGVADPEIPPLALTGPDARVPARHRSAMLSSSFGFGGSNAAVLLGRGC